MTAAGAAIEHAAPPCTSPTIRPSKSTTGAPESPGCPLMPVCKTNGTAGSDGQGAKRSTETSCVGAGRSRRPTKKMLSPSCGRAAATGKGSNGARRSSRTSAMSLSRSTTKSFPSISRPSRSVTGKREPARSTQCAAVRTHDPSPTSAPAHTDGSRRTVAFLMRVTSKSSICASARKQPERATAVASRKVV